ncbi:MAG: helix-hairpin-helix domain-containing protein [Burkholderiales bacterium]|nr:MAG: helix-hairpin-helix domain-containing protein [Burkholderiales bacterium]
MKTLLLAFAALLLSISTAFAAVNANTASVDELQLVAGIGPTIAQRIVDERRNGPYKSLDDIQARVKGVGETSIRKMGAAGLTVGGERAGTKSGSTGDAKVDAKADATPDTKPSTKAETKAETKADAKSGAKVDAKADAKGGAKPAPKAEARP